MWAMTFVALFVNIVMYRKGLPVYCTQTDHRVYE